MNALALAKFDENLLPSCQIFRGMSNSDRLVLLCSLMNGEKTVTELGAATGIRQPSLSQQLGVLRTEGIIRGNRDGTYIRYSIANPVVITIMKLLYEHYCNKN
jgi:DNA-binding transcriptional ArsR family regulator